MKISNIGTYNLKIYAEDDCGNRTDATRTVIAKDIPVTLTFECNGGIPLNSVLVDKGTTFDLNTKVTTKTDWYFDGWYDNPELSGNAITSILMDSDKTVYAKWVDDKFNTYVFGTSSNNRTLGINVPLSRLSDYTYQYGSVVATYDPWTEEEQYNFQSINDQPWGSYRTQIKQVVLGQTIKPFSLDFWFDGFTTFTTFNSTEIAKIDVSELGTMKAVFRDCYQLDNVDLSWWRDKTKLWCMQSAFQNCSSMNNWNFTYFNTNTVEDFSYAFAGIRVRNSNIGATNLTNALNLQNLTFDNALTVSHMFSNADLDYLILLRFSPTKPFPNCTNFNSMFSNITARGIFSEAFAFGSGTITDDFMFGQAYYIEGGAGTTYNSAHIDREYAHPDLGDAPGYFRGSVVTQIHYNENGGEPITPNPQLVTTGESVNLLRTTKAGYKLESWYADPNFEEKAGTGFRVKIPYPQFYVYAKWIEPPIETKHYMFRDGSLGLGVADDDLDNQVAIHGPVLEQYTNNPSATQSLFYAQRAAIKSVFCASEKVLLQPTANGFKDLYKLETVDISNLVAQPSLDFSSMFVGCIGLRSVIADIDGSVNPITSMANMFDGCYWLDTVVLPTIPQNSTYPLTRMDYMFRGCHDVGTHVDLSNIYMNDVTDMSWLFYQCETLQKVTLPANLDTRNCQALQYLFGRCPALTEVVNHGLIDTRSSQYLTGMWSNTKLEVIDCSKYSTLSAVGVGGLFMDCTSLKTIYAGAEFIMRPTITGTRYVFSNCPQLVGGNGTAWQSSYENDGNMMWIDGSDGRIGLFTMTANTEAYASYNESTKTLTFFRDAPNKYTQGQVIGDNFYFTNIENITDWEGIWYTALKNECEYVVSDNRYEYEIAGAKSMFKSFVSVKTIDLRPMNFHGTDMTSMFQACRSLTDIQFGTGWDTNNVKIMTYTFNGCSALTTTKLAQAMQYWRAEEVQNCSGLFYNCVGVESIDLTNFGFASTTDTSYMFCDCPNLTTIIVDETKSFAIGYITSSTLMFGSCYVLVGQNGTAYDSNYTNKTRAYVDTASQPGYLTAITP